MLQSPATTSGLLAGGFGHAPRGHAADVVAHALRIELDRRMTQLLLELLGPLVGLQLKVDLQGPLARLVKTQGASQWSGVLPVKTDSLRLLQALTKLRHAVNHRGYRARRASRR